jgi:uncharacterized membrane protein YsdA (DUF1294 family)
MTWLHKYPARTTLAVALGTAVVGTIGLWNWLSGSWTAGAWLLAWLASLNVTTFVIYGVDKWQAKNEGWRVPETTLLILAFLGGSLGAWAAMLVFRHKTIKGSFRRVFWLLVLVQLASVFLLVRAPWS